MNDWIFHDYAAKTLIEKKEILGQSGRRKGFAISSESKGKETERESGKDKNRVGLEWSRGSPLEIVGDLVLEAGGRVDLPLRELLL